MAENVGSVEINVDVDTHNMSQQIERAANRAARVYGKEFSATAGGELNSLFSKAGARMRTSAAREGTLSGEGFAEAMEKSVVARVKRWDLDISEGVVFGNWRKAVSTFDDVDDAVKRITARMEFLRKEGELTKAQYESSTASLRKWVAESRRLTVEQQKAAKAAKATADANKGVSADREREAATIAKLAKVIKDQQVAQRKLTVEEDRSFRLLSRLRGSRNNFLHLMGGLGQVMEGIPRLLTSVGTGFANFASGISDAVRQGQGFGKITGGLRAGVQGLAGAFGKLKAVNPATLLLGIVAGALQLGFVGNLITSLAGGISGLTGIITAFAASLTYALGGALLSVGPMLGALAVGVGAVTIAVSKNQDAFKKAVGPLTDWADEVSGVVAAGLLPRLSSAADDLASTLSTSVTPLLRDAGAAVGDFAKSFADELGSKAMGRNLKVFQTTWPNILRNLGDAFSSVFSGISGILAAISPKVEDITGGFADAAENFSEWANSVEGQKSIKTFFDEAWESAQLLWDILKNVGSALGSVFGAGKDTGDSFLESIERITGEFAKWADSPEGQREMKEFFEDAKDLASDLWDLVEEIGTTFDEWDTSETRKDFETIVGAVESIVSGLSAAVTFADGLWESITFQEGSPAQGWINDALFGGEDVGAWWDENVVGWWEDTAQPWLDDLWSNVGPEQGWWESVFGGPEEWWAGVTSWWDTTVTPWFDEQSAAAGEAWDEMWGSLGDGLSEAWSGVTNWWNGTAYPWFASLPAQVGGWFSRMWGRLTSGIGTAWASVVNWWNGTAYPWFASLPAAVGGWFSRMWGRLTSGLSTAWGRVTTWWTGTAMPWFQGLPGRVGGFFAQMWGRLTNGIGKGWAKVTGWWNGTAVPWFKSLPGKVGGWFSNMWGQFTNGIGKGWAKVTGWWNGTAVPWFKSLPGKVGGWFSNMWGQLTNGISKGWRGVTGWWNNTAMPWFRSLPGKVRGFFERMWQGLVDATVGVVGGIRDWWNGTALPAIKGMFSTDTLYQAGRDLINGLLNGIKSIPVIGTAASIAGDLISSVKGKLGIGSPSKVFHQIGSDTMEGFRRGMLGEQRALARTAGSVGGLIEGAMGGTGRGSASVRGGNVNPTRVGAARSVVVSEGAIRVVTPTHDPVQVAQMTVDRLVRSVVG